jgi:hypothetical protein
MKFIIVIIMLNKIEIDRVEKSNFITYIPRFQFIDKIQTNNSGVNISKRNEI